MPLSNLKKLKNSPISCCKVTPHRTAGYKGIKECYIIGTINLWGKQTKQPHFRQRGWVLKHRQEVPVDTIEYLEHLHVGDLCSSDAAEGRFSKASKMKLGTCI